MQAFAARAFRNAVIFAPARAAEAAIREVALMSRYERHAAVKKAREYAGAATKDYGRSILENDDR